jgi:hypothetical protein
MKELYTRQLLLICAASLFMQVCGLNATAQQQQQNTPPAQAEQKEETDDVVRINTELVQTDVMVFDKQGRFVEGLKPEQFLLKVDGKPRRALRQRYGVGSDSVASARAEAFQGAGAVAVMVVSP